MLRHAPLVQKQLTSWEEVERQKLRSCGGGRCRCRRPLFRTAGGDDGPLVSVERSSCTTVRLSAAAAAAVAGCRRQVRRRRRPKTRRNPSDPPSVSLRLPRRMLRRSAHTRQSDEDGEG